MKNAVQNFFVMLACLLFAANTLQVEAQVMSEILTGNRTDANTKVRELDRLVDSLQTALDLPIRNVMPESRSGARAMARLDQRALAATFADMYEELGIEGEIPTRLTPRVILSMMSTILLAAAETPPTVQTNIADGIESVLAIMNGAVTKDGRKPLDYWGFKMGTDSTLSDSILVPFGDYQGFLDTSAVDTGAFYLEKTGLSPSTTYYFSAWAENVNGISHGDTLSFLTRVGVTTNAATDITDSTGTISATIGYGDVQPTSLGMKWGLADDLSGASDSLFVLSSDSTITWTLGDLVKDSTYYYTAYAANATGTQYGDTLNFKAMEDACLGEETVSYHGHDYSIVGIGTQCWFAENLNTSQFLNGDDVLFQTTDEAIQAYWADQNSTAPAYSIYFDAEDQPIYGGYYNWYAITDSRGICPTGYHVPVNNDWAQLSEYVGLETEELRASDSDSPPWNGVNTTGFSASPNGYLDQVGGAQGVGGNYAIYWQAEDVESSGELWGFGWNVPQNNGTIYGQFFHKSMRLSVRCLKDAPLD